MKQTYEIEAVRKQCLDLLRKEGRTLTAGQIAMELRLPMWAVHAGLDSARTARLALFTPGAGWSLDGVITTPPVEHEQGGLL